MQNQGIQQFLVIISIINYFEVFLVQKFAFNSVKHGNLSEIDPFVCILDVFFRGYVPVHFQFF